MRVLTKEEMQLADAYAIEQIGIPSLVLMELAGVRVVEALEHRFGSLEGKRVGILVGPGNNGGDGLVVARHLLLKKARVKVYLVARDAKLSSECKHNLELYRKLSGDIQGVSEKQLMKVRLALSMNDIVVDALLGVGSSLPLRGLLLEVVKVVNGLRNPKVCSVDLPTGVNPTSGEVPSIAIKADLTVSLAYPKTGLYFFPGREYAGEVVVADIGVPEGCSYPYTRYLATEDLQAQLPKRVAYAHKGMCGKGLVIAGSPSFAGAAYLSAMGMVRGGCGLVTLAVPSLICDRFPPAEFILRGLPHTKEGQLDLRCLPLLKDYALDKDALVIGPGLGVHAETKEFVYGLLEEFPGKVVLDADALNAFGSDFPHIVEILRDRLVITPHLMEFHRISGIPLSQIEGQRLSVVEQFSALYPLLVLLLKGTPTVVSQGKTMYLSTTGTSAMASGGMGDVLSGVIGALLSQGMAPLLAATLGAFVHGRAGELQGVKRGLAASDLLQTIPKLLP